MKRLLFLPHSSEPSGAPRVTVDLARRLSARGWKVEVLLPTPGRIAGEARAMGLPVSFLGYPDGSFAAAGWLARGRMIARRALALLRLWFILMSRRPDAAWVGSSVALPFLLTCRLAGIRTVVHVHEHPNVSQSHRLRVKLIRRLAHGVVFVGPLASAPFRPRPRGQTWAVLANPLDHPPKSNDRAALRRNLGAEEKEIVFVCAAFLNPRKDHETLLRAFALAMKRAENIRLWIVGGEVAGHEGALQELKSLAEKLGVSRRVNFTGLRDDSRALLQAGDVCVLASREEAMPLSIAEAQLAGRAVVATRVGDVAAMVPDGRCGYLVQPGDAEGLAEGMVRLATDPQMRRQFGEAASKHARQMYSAETLMPQFERMIRRVARA